jgi:hypothetical protein
MVGNVAPLVAGLTNYRAVPSRAVQNVRGFFGGPVRIHPKRFEWLERSVAIERFERRFA